MRNLPIPIGAGILRERSLRSKQIYLSSLGKKYQEGPYLVALRIWARAVGQKPLSAGLVGLTAPISLPSMRAHTDSHQLRTASSQQQEN